jgi:hypothetical protein
VVNDPPRGRCAPGYFARGPAFSYVLSLSPFDVREVAVVNLAHVSPRITVQQGAFTVHPLDDRTVEQWELGCSKILIDAAKRVGLRTELHGIGLDHRLPDDLERRMRRHA